MTRDFSPLYDHALCVICGAIVHDRELHADEHLRTAEAVVQLDYRKVPPTEQVVATESLPVTSDDGSIWDATTSGDPEWKDTNSVNLRRALTELAATRRRIARAAKDAR